MLAIVSCQSHGIRISDSTYNRGRAVHGQDACAEDAPISSEAKPSALKYPARMTTRLDDSFPEFDANGGGIRASFQQVADDTLEAVRKRFELAAPVVNLPIIIGLGTGPVPLTYPPGNDSIKIELTLDPARFDYTRFTYQLSHELGHVMFDAYRTNGLIETLCDALSLQILDDLGEKWPSEYSDYAAWRDFAPNFHAYRISQVESHLKRLPIDIQRAIEQRHWQDVTAFLKHHRTDLEHDPYGEQGLALRTLSALALLSRPVPWKELVGIARLTTPDPEHDPSFRKDLSIDLGRAPAAAQCAIEMIRD
jgi:hypothetical protein